MRKIFPFSPSLPPSLSLSVSRYLLKMEDQEERILHWNESVSTWKRPKYRRKKGRPQVVTLFPRRSTGGTGGEPQLSQEGTPMDLQSGQERKDFFEYPPSSLIIGKKEHWFASGCKIMRVCYRLSHSSSQLTFLLEDTSRARISLARIPHTVWASFNLKMVLLENCAYFKDWGLKKDPQRPTYVLILEEKNLKQGKEEEKEKEKETDLKETIKSHCECKNPGKLDFSARHYFYDDCSPVCFCVSKVICVIEWLEKDKSKDFIATLKLLHKEFT